jgi:hypothetical protein
MRKSSAFSAIMGLGDRKAESGRSGVGIVNEAFLQLRVSGSRKKGFLLLPSTHPFNSVKYKTDKKKNKSKPT